MSKADGPIVREFGDGIEHVLDERLDEKNKDLATKLNQQIQKKKDKFRLSATDTLKKTWLDWFQDAAAVSTVQDSAK